MDSEKVIKRDNEYVLHTYARNPIVLEKGHGLYAEGPEGQKYLDFTSGIGVNSLGYCDMTWAEIAAASRTDPMISSLIDCAQTGFARPLTHREMEKLVNLYMQEGFAPAAMVLRPVLAT